jgi:hypothetical protein
VLELFSSILNNALYVSILVILASSFVGFYAKSRMRDRCMRDFDGFTAMVEDKEGKVVWGTLRVYSSGIELLYLSTHRDIQGHVENSYILYDSDLGNLQAIYRFHHEQSEENQRRRTKEIKRTYQPTIFRQAMRMLRNLLSTFKDAIAQTLNAVLGYRATQSPQNVMLSKHKEFTASGVQLLSSAVGNAYEPILERYIGQYVVLDILREKAVEEEHGILKEYSAKYIELLNAKVEVPLEIYLREPSSADSRPVKIERDGCTVRVTNDLDSTLLIEAVKSKKGSRQVSVPVHGKQCLDIELSVEEAEKTIELELSVRCLADLIVPRSQAAVRHAGKREKLSLDTLLGLDELPYLPWVKRLIGAEKSAGFRSEGEHLDPEREVLPLA